MVLQQWEEMVVLELRRRLLWRHDRIDRTYNLGVFGSHSLAWPYNKRAEHESLEPADSILVDSESHNAVLSEPENGDGTSQE